jgi:hypothetical protein
MTRPLHAAHPLSSLTGPARDTLSSGGAQRGGADVPSLAELVHLRRRRELVIALTALLPFFTVARQRPGQDAVLMLLGLVEDAEPAVLAELADRIKAIVRVGAQLIRTAGRA